MDLRLRNSLISLQENYADVAKKLARVRDDYRQLLKQGRKIYKQTVTADPTLADLPVWNSFRQLLGIDVGLVDPPEPGVPDDDNKATQDVVVAIAAVNKLSTYEDLTPAKKANLLAELELALVNARASLS